GIVCILGTGSNSCYHRQAQVVEVKGGLGYIVGDEGSGADLGKHLLKAILQDDMPPHIVQKFEDHFQKTAQQMLTQVMLASKPNVMLASWAPLLHQWAGEAAVEQLIVDRFLAFLDTTVCRYEAYKRLTVDFVGSIAHHFAPQLSQACHQCQLRLGTIDKDPVHKLVQYHLFGLRE
ncbi:MAG: ATPase, partial [Bacteroidetes bacterium]